MIVCRHQAIAGLFCAHILMWALIFYREETMKQSKKFLGIGAILLLAACMIFAYLTFAEQAVEGHKFVTIEVVDDAERTTTYEVHTDALYLQQAMEQTQGLSFAYADGAYGASVHTVNGVRADYTLDKAYWGFFVNGEYCSYGITQQPVEDGDIFRIVYTPA